MKRIPKGLNQWLATGNRGLSSETIVSVLTQFKILQKNNFYHPRDPSDFNRCVELLNQVPSLKSKLKKMKNVSPQWNALVTNWDNLVETLEKEKPSGSCPILYKKMEVLFLEA